MRTHPRQLEMEAIVDAPPRPVPRTWGGRRAGAGRPKKAAKDRTFVPHHPRAIHKKRHPTHVTLRARRATEFSQPARADDAAGDPRATPSEVRRALVYVLQNVRKHGFELLGAFIDPLTTAKSFLGWTMRPTTDPDPFPPRTPRTWLLGEGWSTHGGGPLSPYERPA